MVKTNATTGQKASNDIKKITRSIRSIPDFPLPGILFRDITPVLAQPKLFSKTIKLLSAPFKTLKPDLILGIESRGFLFASAMAHELKCGIVPVRKKGKLPGATFSENYDLEYGQNALEIHQDAFTSGKRAIIADDVIATGGTALAAARLAQKAGGEIIGFSFFIELTSLSGRQKLNHQNIHALIQY